MEKIEPVGHVAAISPSLPKHLDVMPERGPSTASQADTFKASLLGQHALLLDPDDADGAEADADQLADALLDLLQLLEERLGNMQQRALMSGGHPSHGMLQELCQVEEVLHRLLPLWRHPLLQALHDAALPRLRGIFGCCHFLLQILSRLGESSLWQGLQQALLRREYDLLS